MTVRAAALACVLLPLLASCGGGGGGGDAAGNLVTGPSTGAAADENRVTADALWAGSTTDGRNVSLLVLDNGAFWTLYTSPSSGFPPSQPLGGFMTGSGASMPGSPQGTYAATGQDFNFEGFGINSVAIDADYVPRQTFDGTITYTAFTGMLGFSLVDTGGYDPAASLGAIAGSYVGNGRPGDINTGGSESVSVTVSSSGTITGSTAVTGCTFGGRIAPRRRGNVFDISVQFSGANCADSLASVSGVVLADAADGTLIALAANAARTDGFLFEGTRR